MRLIDADAFWAQFEEGENKLSLMKSIFPPEIIDVTLKIYAELKERLDSMPSFEPQSQWVPISERLPEPDTYVLLSFENCSLADIGRYERDETGGAFIQVMKTGRMHRLVFLLMPGCHCLNRGRKWKNNGLPVLRLRIKMCQDIGTKRRKDQNETMSWMWANSLYE